MGMDIHGKSGNYFRANVWSWRPIHQLVSDLNDSQLLGLNLHLWGSNDGAGLHTQEDCDALAKAIESYIAGWPEGREYSVDLGVYVNDNGQLLKPGETGGKSAYYTDREHLAEFVEFLRNCGGEFTID